jgi:hypothetical protein
VSLPLTTHLLPPYDPIKGMMRAPPLFTVPTPALISPPHTRNNLSIGAPPTTSVEHRRVTISVAPPPSDTIGENPDDLLSLSLSLSLWAIMMTSWAIERPCYPMVASSPCTESQPLSRDSYTRSMTFSIEKMWEILENTKVVGKPLDFLINKETTPTFFKLAPELYHN